MNPLPGGRVINLSGPRDALPEFDNMESEEPLAANKFIADTPANREMVAHQHGLLGVVLQGIPAIASWVPFDISARH